VNSYNVFRKENNRHGGAIIPTKQNFLKVVLKNIPESIYFCEYGIIIELNKHTRAFHKCA